MIWAVRLAGPPDVTYDDAKNEHSVVCVSRVEALVTHSGRIQI